MFDQLLLAIDDSAASEVATVFSAGLAQRFSASVHVFHVNEYQVGGVRRLTLRTNDDVAALLANAIQQLRDSGVQASGSSCADTYRRVPARIVQAALDRGVDAIVLGSNRHRRLGRLFSTRVRERTTRGTSLPVLTSPSPLNLGSLNLDDVVREHLDSDRLIVRQRSASPK